MLKFLFFLIFFTFTCTMHSQQENSKYNKALADSLGADDYGMKMYVFVILTSGKNIIADKKVTDSLFAGHMKNIGDLAEKGKLIVAGPMKKNDKNYRGIFILNVKTFDEALALLETDPAIKADLLAVEMFNWYGSAALPMYLKYNDLARKRDILQDYGLDEKRGGLFNFYGLNLRNMVLYITLFKGDLRLPEYLEQCYMNV